MMRVSAAVSVGVNGCVTRPNLLPSKIDDARVQPAVEQIEAEPKVFSLALGKWRQIAVGKHGARERRNADVRGFVADEREPVEDVVNDAGRVRVAPEVVHSSVRRIDIDHIALNGIVEDAELDVLHAILPVTERRHESAAEEEALRRQHLRIQFLLHPAVVAAGQRHSRRPSDRLRPPKLIVDGSERQSPA